jgi:CIC family chloride channel protein
MGWNTIFSTPEFIFRNPVELLFYALFGVLCALLGILYVKVFYGIHDKFALLPIPKYFKPAIGGFLLGVLALFFPYILGSGYGWIQMAIDGHLALEMMLLAAILKVFATSFSIGSGGSGGIFAPSLFMGAMLGGAFGGLANQFFPDIITQPTAFVLVGMAAFFAGAANVPISMTIMITEMTGGYALLVPLILASTLAFFIARKWSIYSQQVKNHAESPAHRGELIVDILNDISVESAYKRPKGKILQIRNNLPIQRILPLFANREEDLFPVVNEQGKLTGLLSMSTLRAIIGEDEIDNLIVAEDIKTQLETVSPSENLHQALGKFIQTKYTSLPVVDEAEPDKVLGLLGYQDLITAYDNALIEWTKET